MFDFRPAFLHALYCLKFPEPKFTKARKVKKVDIANWIWFSNQKLEKVSESDKIMLLMKVY